jgi:hypothetical protein
MDEETDGRDHQQGWQIHLSRQEICPKNRSHPSDCYGAGFLEVRRRGGSSAALLSDSASPANSCMVNPGGNYPEVRPPDARNVGLEHRRHFDIELHSIGSAQITLWNYLCFFSLIPATRDIGAKTRGAFVLLLSKCSSTRSYGRDYRIRLALKDSPPIGELPTTLRPYHLAER